MRHTCDASTCRTYTKCLSHINICHLYYIHSKTLIEIAMVLSKNSGSFSSNSHVSATFSILLRFVEFCNPTNCEKNFRWGFQTAATGEFFVEFLLY